MIQTIWGPTNFNVFGNSCFICSCLMKNSLKITWRRSKYVAVFMFIFNYALQSFKAYCAIWVRRSNFRHQASPRVSPCESTQRRKVELWARNIQAFCLNVDLHVTFRDFLHAVKLRHETDGFTSPPKEGVLRIFLFANLRTWVPNASTLPLDHRSRYVGVLMNYMWKCSLILLHLLTLRI
jgi:hypothetical protein